MSANGQELRWSAVLDDAITPILERIATTLQTISDQLVEFGNAFQLAADQGQAALIDLNFTVDEVTASVQGLAVAQDEAAAATDDNTAATDANTAATDENAASKDANAASTDNAAASSRRGANDLLMFGLAATAAAAGVIYMGTQADDALTRVAALTGATPAQMQVYTDAIEQMAGDVGKSVTDLANGLYDVISAGFNNTSDALNVMHYSAELAATGMVDLHTVTAGVTKIMVAYGIAGSDASSVTDALLVAVKDGNVTFEDFSNAIGLVGEAAKGAGYTLDEASAALSTLTRVFPNSRRAAQDLDNMFRQFSDNVATMQKNADKLGITFDANAFSSMNLTQQLQYLSTITGGNSLEEEKIIGNSTAWSAAQVLLSGNMQAFTGILGDVENSTGATDKAFNTHKDSIGSAADQLGGKFSDLATKITDIAKPAVMDAFNTVANAIGNLGTFVGSHQQVILAFFTALGIVLAGGLAAGLVAVALSVGSALAGLSGIVAIVGGVVAGVGFLVVGFIQLYQHSKPLRDAIADVVTWIDKARTGFLSFWNTAITPVDKSLHDFQDNIENITGVFSKFTPSLNQISNDFHSWLEPLMKGNVALGNWLPSIQLMASNIMSSLVPGLHAFWSILQQIGGLIQSQLGEVWKQLVQTFNDDLVPAWNALVATITPYLPELELLGGIIGGLLVVALGVLVGLLAGVIKFLGTAVSGIIQLFGGLVRFFSGWIEVITAPIGFLISAISDLLKGKGLQGVLDDFKRMLEQMGQGALNILGGLWDAVIGLFKTAFLSIYNLVAGFVQTFIAFCQHLFDQLIGHSLFPDLVNGILSWIGRLPGEIGQLISNLVGNFLSTLGGLKDKAVAAIVDVWNSITSTVSGWANQATQWGVNLIQGFINGIKNMAGKVGDAVSGIAKTVSKFLGFGSPTEEGPGKTLNSWGPNLVKGFADGIASTAPAVAAAATMIATTLAKGMTQPVTAPGANALLGAGVNPLALGAGAGAVQNQTITLNLNGGLGAGLQLLNGADRTTFIRQIAQLLAEQRGLQTIGVQGYAGR